MSGTMIHAKAGNAILHQDLTNGWGVCGPGTLLPAASQSATPSLHPSILNQQCAPQQIHSHSPGTAAQISLVRPVSSARLSRPRSASPRSEAETCTGKRRRGRPEVCDRRRNGGSSRPKSHAARSCLQTPLAALQGPAGANARPCARPRARTHRRARNEGRLVPRVLQYPGRQRVVAACRGRVERCCAGWPRPRPHPLTRQAWHARQRPTHPPGISTAPSFCRSP